MIAAHIRVALAAAALSLCSACTREEAEFRYRGQVWKAEFFKGIFNQSINHIIDPNGNSFSPTDPSLPFRIVQAADGTYHWEQGAPSAKTAPRAATGPNQVYFLDVYAQDQILIFDQATARYVANIPVPVRPQGIAINPDGSTLYVTHLAVEPGSLDAAPAPPRISVIDIATRRIVQTITLPAGSVPRKPLSSPDGLRLYVPDSGSFVAATGFSNAGVIVIDAQTRAVTGNLPLATGQTVDRLAITPDGAVLYAIPLQSTPSRLHAFDTLTGELIASVPVNLSLRDIVVDSTGTRLYVTSTETVVAFHTATLSEAARISIPGNPRINGLQLSFDGGSLFANHAFSSAVSRVDTATNQFAETLGDPSNAIDGSFALLVPIGPSPP